MGEVVRSIKFGSKAVRAKRVIHRIREALTPSRDYKPDDFNKVNHGTYPGTVEKFYIGRMAANSAALISDTDRRAVWGEIVQGTDEELNEEKK